MPIQNVQLIQINKVTSNGAEILIDKVVVEEPIEIQLEYNNNGIVSIEKIAVTMRTPGKDMELALGFLFTEGIIKSYNEIEEVVVTESDQNIVRVILKNNCKPVLKNVQRNFFATSSCGICGKASIDAIKTISRYKSNSHIKVYVEVLFTLQNSVVEHQKMFADTGGLHACALFSKNGKCIELREDVGRHNALDKLIGNAVVQGKLPLKNIILFLSGRTSFELIQKAIMAGIKVIVAVGAPSSLAVQLSIENDITLIGFLKKDRFNVYSGMHRLVESIS